MSIKKQAKQVIVVRKDLNMRKGKMVAQSCHASLGAILSCADHDVRTQHTVCVTISLIDNTADNLYDKRANPHPLREWLQGSFTKICVSVDSEQELIDIHQIGVLYQYNQL